jgi:minor extracellular serine protease Vpr
VVRRLLALLSILALTLPTATLAKDPTHEPQRTGFTGTIDPQVLPYAMDDTRDVTVMLEMRGDPVAVVESRAPGRELSVAQKDRIKAELKGRQDAIKGRIAAEGGEVLSQLQSAYNGVKVRISRADVAALATLPNVVAVRAIQKHTPGNATSVPYIGVPGDVWEDLGFTGAGVKIAVIDTGIDYTHANFGGPGTVAAFELADENDTALGDAGDAGIFGEGGSSKVAGGWDFAGDDYDATGDDGDPVPSPDADPLDCNGHGSHVAGSAAGYGVRSDGTTYTGPYDSTTPSNDFNIGPGVAPEAELYALRVFGCLGSTDVTVEAIDWAVDNEMDVINMSLGSSFGRRDDPSAVASTNAAASGVIVVTSSGNSGPSQYITGSPGTGTGAIATAAVDSNETFLGVDLALSTGATITTISANGVVPPDGTQYNVVVLKDDPATADEDESLGCSVEAFTKAGITDNPEDPPTLAVSRRNTCARVARAVFGQQAGADAVAMINNAPGLPPFEGPISGNPDTGESFEVTIPFLGIRGSDAATITAADGKTATTTATDIANPGFQGFASFSSGGPTNGDSFLKPDIAAPGVSIASTGVGTGNKAAVISGTSMASPHIAGVAALVREAHPTWDVSDVKAAITNSGSPAGLPGYTVTRAGAGLVTPAAAVGTDVVALGDFVEGDASLPLADFHNSNLSFGFEELGADYSETRTITVKNHGEAAVTLTPSAVASAQSRPATVSFGAASVEVAAGGEVELEVTLTVPAASVGSSFAAAGNPAFREVSGNVELNAEGISLRVPYLLVPRALSTIETTVQGNLTPAGRTATVTNPNGVIAGTADFFQLGLEDGNDVNEAALGGSGYDLQAVGVQAFPDDSGDSFLAFAVSTHDRWSNAAVNEFDIVMDTTGDGAADYVLIGFDLGALTTGSFDGRYASFLLDLSNPSVLSPLYFAQAPHDSSSVVLFADASDFGLTPEDGDFSYTVQSFSLEGNGQDAMSGTAKFDAFKPALADFPFTSVAPGGSAQVDLTFDGSAFAKQKPLGVMVVSQDDAAGAEAQLLKMNSLRRN